MVNKRIYSGTPTIAAKGINTIISIQKHTDKTVRFYSTLPFGLLLSYLVYKDSESLIE